MLGLASFRSESTFVVFLSRATEGGGRAVFRVLLPVKLISVEGKIKAEGKMGAPSKQKDRNKGSVCVAVSTTADLSASQRRVQRGDQAVPGGRSPAHQKWGPGFLLDWRVLLILNVF